MTLYERSPDVREPKAHVTDSHIDQARRLRAQAAQIQSDLIEVLHRLAVSARRLDGRLSPTRVSHQGRRRR
jgi:hypothetical protein